MQLLETINQKIDELERLTIANKQDKEDENESNVPDNPVQPPNGECGCNCDCNHNHDNNNEEQFPTVRF